LNIPPRSTIPNWKSAALGLGLLTFGAVLVEGYHPFAEDAEIYLPGVEKILHPELYPTGQEFFLSHARMTLFPNLVAFSLRVTHLPMEAGLFLWHLASILFLLLACWQLSGLLFSNEKPPHARARWGGVCLVAALLTIPVAGTALYIMDQYLNPRNLAAFAGIFMVVQIFQKKYVRALLWLAFAACMHPLMWTFPFSFCVLLLVMERCDRWKSTAGLGGYRWRLRLPRPTTRPRNGTATITSRTGHGMSGWGSLRRWYCSGGFETSRGVGSGLW